MTRQEKKALFEQVERSINVPSQPHGLEAAVLAEIMNFQDRDGRTLLMRSTTKEQLEMSRTLIEMGADVNLQDKKGWSALHFAAQSYLPDHTLLLLEHGADVHLQDVYGNTPYRALYLIREAEERSSPFFCNMVRTLTRRTTME
ncbi:MAG: ankyrin repeat domain-containing protein [Saprospiraceae bacterium]|nr:ankyrin repeat domain-containing protein [Saprospiraceae bacterium]